MPDTSAPPASVSWDPAFLDLPEDEALDAWGRSMGAYCARLPPERAVRFAMAFERWLDRIQNSETLRYAGPVHPKHELMRYHDFFVERIRPDERVLDLGCGYGAVALSIARRCACSVVGMDYNAEHLDRARAAAHEHALAERTLFIPGDITTERAEGAFDVVVLSNVLEHIDRRIERLRTWIGWYAPSRVLIRVPAYDRDWKTPWRERLGMDFFCDDDHETEYTEASLRDELTRAGLEPVELITRFGEYWAACRPRGR